MNFGDKEVLRVFATANRPLSTIEVARACRRAAGKAERAAEAKEVRYALLQLVDRGVIVSGTRDGDPQFRHLASPLGRERWWATPAVSVVVRAASDARAACYDAADHDRVRFQSQWVAAGGPPSSDTIPNPYASVIYPGSAGLLDGSPDRPPVVSIRLTSQQLAWLLTRLQ